MLRLSATISNIPVMSIRTGGKVATAIKPLINPNNLRIEGWFCEDYFNHQKTILLAKDVREFVPQGIAINDYADLSEPSDLVRLQQVIEIDYDLLGKRVITNHKRRLGKIEDYALETTSLLIQKLYVRRPIHRSITEGQLSIDRSQIVEITDRDVIVREAEVRAKQTAPSIAPATS